MVGSGIVAVELAADLAYIENGPKVNLVVRGSKLLNQFNEKAGQIASEQLTQKGVTIHYNTPYSEAVKKEKGFDLVFSCVGQTYNADFLKKSFASSVANNG